MVVLTLNPSGPPKRQIIELAFGDIGSAGYEFGRTPEEINDALLRLNALMLEWPLSALGYAQPTYGVGSPDDLSGIAAKYLNAVASQLAMRICPMMGATLSPEARGNMSRSMALLRAEAALIPTMPFANSTPSGAGSRGVGTFLRTPLLNKADPGDPGNLAGLIG